MDNERCVILIGNPFEGLQVAGPFDSRVEAEDYGLEHFAEEDWWVGELLPYGEVG